MRRFFTFATVVLPALLLAAEPSHAEGGFLSKVYILGEAGALFSSGSGAEVVRFTNTAVVNTENKDLGAAGMLGVGIGTRFSPLFRGDVTFNARWGMEWQTSGLSTTSQLGYFDTQIDTYALMANAYWDIHRFELERVGITPYLSGGVGLAINKAGSTRIRSGPTTIKVKGTTNTDFAFQLGGGFGLDLSEHISLDAGYRYVDLGEFKTGTNGDLTDFVLPVQGDIAGHEMKIGLRYSF